MSRFLTTTEAAAQLGVSLKTLARWRDEEADGAPRAPCSQPGGPRGPMRWRGDDLQAWVDARDLWHRRRHLRVLRAREPEETPRQESLFLRAMKRAGRR